MGRRETVHLVVTRKGAPIADFVTEVDLDNTAVLQQYLREAVVNDGWDAARVDEFVLHVQDPVTDRVLQTVRVTVEG